MTERSMLRKIPTVRRFHLRRESKPEIRLDYLVADRRELHVKNSSNKTVTVWIRTKEMIYLVLYTN